jgi:hypothetical protein
LVQFYSSYIQVFIALNPNPQAFVVDVDCSKVAFRVRPHGGMKIFRNIFLT